MPQQHNPGRHVQSLTLPQSRHNHRNTSAYIFPTVSTPRTTPPTPGTASPRRRAPTLQLPVATRPPHSRHTPAAAQRFHRPDASDNPADTGTRHAPGTASPHRRDPTLQHSAATRQRHSRHFPTAAQRPPHHPDASNHPAGAGFNRTAGHKKIRLCEPDLFICQ